MRKKGRRGWKIIVLLAALCILAGCGARSAGSDPETAKFAAAPEAEERSGTDVEMASLSNASVLSASEKDMEDSSYTGSDEEDSAEGETENTAVDFSGEESAAELSRKIVYTGSAQIQTRHYDRAKAQMQKLIKDCGGFISDQSESTNNGWGYSYETESDFDQNEAERVWSLTARIPSGNFDKFFDGADRIDGKVIDKSSSSQDMTRSYSDNQDRLRALRTEQDRLLELLEKADNVADMITIEDKLADVRAEIATLTRSNQKIDYDVSYSTVTVTMDEVKFYSPDKVTFAERIRSALSDSGRRFVSFMQNLLIALVYLLPYLAIAAAVISAAVKIRGTVRKKKKEKENVANTRGEKKAG